MALSLPYRIRRKAKNPQRFPGLPVYNQGMGWKWPSERTDTEFLKGMGIAPCPDLPDPYFRDPHSPPDISLTEKDFALLRGMRIQGWPAGGIPGPATGRCHKCNRPWTRIMPSTGEGWCRECQALTPTTAPYTPPRSMQEYLARYPMGISAAVRSEAPRLGYGLTGDDVRLLTGKVVELLREPVEGGPEDSVGMYAAVGPPSPHEDAEGHFVGYMRLRVMAALPKIMGEDEVPA
jgi:hypothetical protein